MASTATTARTTDHSLGSTIYGNWDQSSDIRNDLAAGWGEEELVIPLGGGGSSSRTSMASAGGAQQQQQQSNNNNDMDEDNWGWKVNQSVVQPVPSFYPMDARSTRRITLSSMPTEKLEDSVVEVGGGEGETSTSVVVDMDETEMGGLIDEDSSSPSSPLPPTIEEVSNRISTACQSLSIYGIWDNNSSSATLCSMERVEMEINLYLDCDVVAGECLSLENLLCDVCVCVGIVRFAVIGGGDSLFYPVSHLFFVHPTLFTKHCSIHPTTATCPPSFISRTPTT